MYTGSKNANLLRAGIELKLCNKGEKRRPDQNFLLLQNDEQMSSCSPVDSQFYRMLLEEGENMGDMMDAEEYLVPQPNLFPRTRGDQAQASGPIRHQSYRVSGERRPALTGSQFESEGLLVSSIHPTFPPSLPNMAVFVTVSLCL